MDRVADELRALRLNVGPTTVGRLLRGMGFSLRVNHKKLCNCSTETRDQQFQYITEMREEFAPKGKANRQRRYEEERAGGKLQE